MAAEKSGAAKFRFIGFAGAMLLEAIGPAGRCSGGVVLIYRFWANLPVLSALRAREGESVVWPLLRGRSPTRSVAPKQQGGSGVLLSGFSSARGCREWRGEIRYIGFAGAMLLEAIGRLGGAAGGV